VKRMIKVLTVAVLMVMLLVVSISPRDGSPHFGWRVVKAHVRALLR
jgi:hypothetical protein